MSINIIPKLWSIPRIGHYIVMLYLITPATIVNYSIIYYFLPKIYNSGHHFILWLSPVIVGDIIAFMMNAEIFKKWYPKNA